MMGYAEKGSISVSTYQPWLKKDMQVDQCIMHALHSTILCLI